MAVSLGKYELTVYCITVSELIKFPEVEGRGGMEGMMERVPSCLLMCMWTCLYDRAFTSELFVFAKSHLNRLFVLPLCEMGNYFLPCLEN